MNNDFIEEMKKIFGDEEDEQELNNIIVLNDEEGNEAPFEFLDLISYKGEDYVVLLPVDESEEAEEVVILQINETDDEETEEYSSIEDEEVLNAVFDIFKERFKDEFNFVD